MKFLIPFSSVLLIFSLVSLSAPLPQEELEKQLKGNGLTGWIHGASEPMNLFVFTYREPGNFFSHQEFPLVPSNDSVERSLKTLSRHDEVKLKGVFLENQAPIRHIWVETVEILKKYEPPVAAPAPYSYEAHLPEDLLTKREIWAKVHAVADEGKILVVEYQDAVVPVFLKSPDLAKNLYRNDKLKLQIQVRNHPPHPTHVELDTQVKNPLQVTDRMTDWHGKKGTVEGSLVLFPKSPQVNFNVFALQVNDENGTRREFTLVNFDDQTVFEKIRAKLQAIWDSHQGGIENGRNKLVNPRVKLKASGTFNVVDPGQANPQVLLAGPDDIKLIGN